ncbi:MAG: multidrug effflux MFS transporter [Ignavibacteria bacterium]|jgi:DHA1 family bicyclomycin/chloramphenicol resistance-like MFS transporter
MPLKLTNKYFIPITTVVLAFLTAMSPFATDTYLSAMPEMAEFFGVGINMVEISLTVYFLGFAVGNFFGGPLSDSFGRKRIALIGIFLYGISAAVIPVSTKIEYVWVFRFIQAFGGGFASVTSMVFVRDWFEGKQVAKLATLIGMIMMLAPLFAPIIGSVLLELFGWQSIFYFLIVFSVLLFAVFSTVMSESRDKTLITKHINVQQFVGKYKIFFSNRHAVLVLLTISSSVAGMFTFITGASFMYIEFYGFKESVFALLFASNIILNVILSLMNTILLKRYEPEQLLRVGLWLQFAAGFALFITVFLSKPPFIVVFISVVIFMGSMGLIFGNGTAVILNLMPEISGSANAMIGVSRFFFSFVTGLLLALFHTGDLVPIGSVMFGCTFIANIYFYFFKKKESYKEAYSE